MWGGDAGLFYTGTYQTDADNVTATVTTNRHTQHPGIASVFGRDQVKISLKGVFAGDTAKFKGSAPEAPGVSFTAELKRIAD
jgi:hypothetical protein